MEEEHLPLATFRVSDDALDPEKITNIIGFEPCRVIKKNEVRLTKHGRRLAPAKTGIWMISTESLSSKLGYNPNDHLLRVLSIAKKHESAIKELYPNCDFSFSVLIHDESFQVKSLSEDLLSQVAGLGELWIDGGEFEEILPKSQK